ncbi:hypothetical protein DFQ03_0626 [Maribacter caenipelagi]|uniref:Membrane or secreted protein n=1 Tax=Maribacter caenipelagi TaxID=1447781 RepID=A0A4R7DBZ2_9FLAO|nr:hypothetical protein [Maribacter caenipelagi]TDS18913.1 hypothetical protein DFQ03_0626 [Maribacter caenipelagi]
MKNNNLKALYFAIVLFFTASLASYSQIERRIYVDTVENNTAKRVHQVKITEDYLIYNEYEIEPAKFIKTVGGFFKIEQTTLEKLMVVLLEFNSDFENDGVRQLSISIEEEGEKLKMNWTQPLTLEPVKASTQDLDGAWLFATRGPDTGQERRGEENSRKTLKLLIDNTFQWIAYDTESFRVSGTGGGTYKAENGIYKEEIEFFSKDNSRVGAQLEFNYKLESDDWHHTGKNSKGELMYEIWSKRIMTGS